MGSNWKPLILASITLMAATAWGQDYRARIQGAVSDEQHALIVGAKVTVTNTATGATANRVTNGTGNYVFDMVEPGNYTLGVEQDGFKKFMQENLTVQVRASLTLDVTLHVGQTTSSVDVTSAPPPVQFASSSVDLVMNNKLVDNLPTLSRSPFLLAMLDASVRQTSWVQESKPYNLWDSSTMQVGLGGGMGRQSDIAIDGAPTQIHTKGSYVPPQDSVQEFSVQQTAVDAEYGHTSGGIINVAMKSGTNDPHGSAYWFGRNPMFNARNPLTNNASTTRNNIFGGNLGNPIIKNKLFTFTSYEVWRDKNPQQFQATLPTDAERMGDYSQSLAGNGQLRTIYDPWSRVQDANGNWQRTPFPGNVIPASQISEPSKAMMEQIWKPNNPGQPYTHVNNFIANFAETMRYWNFGNRTDWIVSDKLRVYGRYGQQSAQRNWPDYSGINSMARYDNSGSPQLSKTISGDAVYSLNASTVFDLRASYTNLTDEFGNKDLQVGEEGLRKIWSNEWYKPYLSSMKAFGLYFPNLRGLDNGTYDFGVGDPWSQHNNNSAVQFKVLRAQGRHALKAGVEWRRYQVENFTPGLINVWSDYGAYTQNAWVSPDPTSGDRWASFLLGAQGSISASNSAPLYYRQNFYGIFLHDDFRLNNRVTLNLGVRYEYDQPWKDDQMAMMRTLDLNSPNPLLQGKQPVMPAEALDTRQSLGLGAPKYNGMFQYVNPNQPGMYNSSKTVFQPRIGVAVRINDLTSLRVGWARFVTLPMMMNDVTSDTGIGGRAYGYTSSTGTLSSLIPGTPGFDINNPFPATNPLIMPYGKQYGGNTVLGDGTVFYNPDYKTPVSDDLNVSLQRALPANFNLELTGYWDLRHNIWYGYSPNTLDPAIRFKYRDALNETTYENPFAAYSAGEMPGALRRQGRISLNQLLLPYPQYSSLWQTNYRSDLRENYGSFKVRLQRPVEKGLSMLLSYNYARDSYQSYINEFDSYSDTRTWFPRRTPRHRMTISSVYELPFGKGRSFLNQMNPVLEGIFGGWSTSSIFEYQSGALMAFDNHLILLKDPRISGADRDRMFDTTAFAYPSDYSYSIPNWTGVIDGLTGVPMFKLDATLQKSFKIKERYSLELKMEAYNLPNWRKNMPSNVSGENYVWWGTRTETNYWSSEFGKQQWGYGAFPREFQYQLRLRF